VNLLIFELRQVISEYRSNAKPSVNDDRSSEFVKQAVPLQFLCNVYEVVVEPLDPKMTTKRVVDELFAPYMKARGGDCLIDVVKCDVNAPQLSAFVRHAIDNQFVLLVQALTKHYKSNDRSEVYIFIDIIAADKKSIEEDLLKRNKKKSEDELVVFNGEAFRWSDLSERLDEVSCLICALTSYFLWMIIMIPLIFMNSFSTSRRTPSNRTSKHLLNT
jgi:hypothetical protein